MRLEYYTQDRGYERTMGGTAITGDGRLQRNGLLLRKFVVTPHQRTGRINSQLVERTQNRGTDESTDSAIIQWGKIA